VVEHVLAGGSALVLMPTGGGKSLCYQVPALCLPGLTVVVSPLIALMDDQVQSLRQQGVAAAALHSALPPEESAATRSALAQGRLKLLYVSPERLFAGEGLQRLGPLSLFAIDEAHCLSQWGHDFRPAYLKIVQLKDYFPKVPFLALTASATSRVKEDIIAQLKLRNPQIFTKSFYRANIAYMVFETEDKLYLLQQILQKNPEPSIIYVTNRKSCLETVHQLESLGFTATYYHGGLTAKEKEKHMKLWMEEKVQVIVATNAFGMGIDKANVKTIIHLHLPQNLENYYQEAGRAGRDGEKAFGEDIVLLVHRRHCEDVG
jgi:ATP-dependent DNA helicase RecQ